MRAVDESNQVDERLQIAPTNSGIFTRWMECLKVKHVENLWIKLWTTAAFYFITKTWTKRRSCSKTEVKPESS